MGIRDRLLAPETQKEITRLLPLPHLLNRSAIKGLVRVIRIIMLKEVLLPVVRAIRLF
jgi:hypothetical protein